MNFYLVFILFLCASHSSVSGEAVQLSLENFDSVIADHKLVVVNFFADWCGYCQYLEPIYNQAAASLRDRKYENNTVLLAKVDCEAQKPLAHRFNIMKYPTIKYFVFGHTMKREYRAGRSAQGFIDFVEESLKDPFTLHENLEKLHEKDGHERRFVGYFNHHASHELHAFRVAAAVFKDECKFDVIVGEFESDVTAPHVEFRPSKHIDYEQHHAFNGSFNATDKELFTWCEQKSAPLVREITFENAEELTEENKAFVLLFHSPNDTKSIKNYHTNVAAELEGDRDRLNFLTANGERFLHPLQHMGKSKDDLPLIAIDSFRHMYVFPNYDDAAIPGRLKAFINDFFSGKLHREYHFGPEIIEISEKSQADVTITTEQSTIEQTITSGAGEGIQIINTDDTVNTVTTGDTITTGDTVTTNDTVDTAKTAETVDKVTISETESQIRQMQEPELQTINEGEPMKQGAPESAFKKLAPSKNRYTMRNEL